MFLPLILETQEWDTVAPASTEINTAEILQLQISRAALAKIHSNVVEESNLLLLSYQCSFVPPTVAG